MIVFAILTNRTFLINTNKFCHVEIDEYCMTRRVMVVEVSGWRVRGRRRLSWMKSVKVTWGAVG